MEVKVNNNENKIKKRIRIAKSINALVIRYIHTKHRGNRHYMHINTHKQAQLIMTAVTNYIM